MVKVRGHQFLIALLLYFWSFSAFADNPKSLDSLSTGKVWLASQILPGSGQIINKQYWKLPVFYSGMGSMIYMGHQANQNYKRIKNEYDPLYFSLEEETRFRERWTPHKVQRNLYFTGAAAFYLASVADALIVKNKGSHSPATATILSTLVPGLGQIYNQKLWKVPVVYGGLGTLYYMVDFNQRGFNRFGEAYQVFPNDEFGGTRSEDELKLLRDAYRRNRDLTIIALFGFYVLNIIDANVDAHFFDWDISDNLALNIEPVLNNSLVAAGRFSEPAPGFKFSFSF